MRSIFGSPNKEVANPSWMTGGFDAIGGFTVTWNRLYIIVFCFVVLGALALILNRTRFGLHMRAVTQNRDMAAAMGIRTARIDALTFGLGSGIAGMAGVALSQIGNVSPNLGTIYIVDSFMVVVFGGVGNLMGTLVGALSLGIVNKLLEPFAGAILGKIVVLVVIILFIQRRPRGLFALKGRTAEAEGLSGCGASPSVRATSAWSPVLGRLSSAAGWCSAWLVPVLNRWVAAEFGRRLPDYLVPLLGKYLCYAILALSLDLVWGYAGILSLGHGAFFALGGYCMGMYLMRQIGTRGVYGNPMLPDFMVFLNWKKLPWFWYGFDHFAYAAAMIMLVPGVLALVFGWLAFRSRVTGVYLSIITQAMTYALWLAFFRNDMGFGGNNGLTDYKDILGWDVHAPATRLGLYLASVVALGIAYLLCRFITASKLGRVLLALRDAESRVRFLGYSVTNAKLFVFTVSAVLAGHRRRALRAAGRHHQSQRVLAGQLDRDRDLGLGRRPRHAGRRDHRRGAGQFCEDLADRRRAGDLAVRARRAVRADDAGLPARHRRAVPAAARWTRAAQPPRSRSRQESRHERPARTRPTTSCSISTASPSASTASRR